MTREELKSRYTMANQPEIMSQMFYEVVDYVCDNFTNPEHEAQLKAKDGEIAMFKRDTLSLSGYDEFMERLESFDFDSFGKDDCFDNSDVYQVLQFFAHKIYGVLGKQIEAKDEEIEELKTQLSSVHNLMYCNGYSDAIDCYDTFGNFNTKHKPNAKARSIVAMLFWESQMARRICGKNNGVYTTIRGQFDRAYAMLKDNK